MTRNSATDHNALQLREFAACCLINAGKWSDAEELVRRHSGALSSRLSLCLGIALINQDRKAEATDVLSRAVDRDASDPMLRSVTSDLFLSLASDKIQAKDWPAASAALLRAVQLEPENREAARMLESVQGMLPMARILGGQRAEAADYWEKEFLRTRSVQVAHHLAILYYWWAQQEADQGDDRFEVIAERWRKAIAYWACVAGDQSYWQMWQARNEAAYKAKPEVYTGLAAAIADELYQKVGAPPGEATGSAETSNRRADLQMDCWMEFEVAKLLRQAGCQASGGPLLCHQIGWPENVQTSASLRGAKGLRLGMEELPFAGELSQLLELCRGGYARSLACLANKNVDRAAETLPKSKGKGETAPAKGLRGCISVRQAYQALIALQCPPEDCAISRLEQYVRQAGAVLKRFKTVQEQYGEAPGVKESLQEYGGICSRRFAHETESLRGRQNATAATKRSKCCIDLLEETLALFANPEVKIALAALWNIHALRLDNEDQDARITSFQRASELEPANALYKKNLCVEFMNRGGARLSRGNIPGFRDDVRQAHRLCPDDPEIKEIYNKL